MRSLTLIIPDLLTTLAQADEAGQSLPYLRRLTQSKAHACAPYDDEPTAFYRWLGETGDLPRAELLALHYKLPPAETWLIAEPIECQADNERIYCLGTAHLDISQAQANELIDSLNQHLVPGGMRLYAPEPMRWLLSLSQPLTVQTQSLNTIVNRAISQTPSVFTELQMLLHKHPINIERERAGKPLIHACWLSGMGKLPIMPKCAHVGVVTENPLTRVLVDWVDAQCIQSLNNVEATVMEYGQHLDEMVICLSAQRHALALEKNEQWDKRLHQIRVYGGDNLCYDATRQGMKKKLPFL